MNRSMLSARLFLAAAGAALLSMAGGVAAQEFPAKPVRVIVPYGPGGVDLQVRVMAPTLARILGQQVVVENREGGGAIIGTTAVKNAAPDGYTVLFTGTSALAVVPHMRKDVGYSLDDFAPIGNATGTPLVVAARVDTPYKTLKELVAYAKASPGKVNMGSSGQGTSTHMAGEAFQLAAGISFTHVPFKGVGAATQGLLGGNSDVVFGLPGVMAPHVAAGKLRILASMGPKRSEFFPDAPTLVESGYDVTEVTRFGFFVPRATPAAVQKKLIDAVAEATRAPEFTEAMKKGSTSVLYLPPAELRAAVVAESNYWGKTLKNPRFAELIQ
jgi:tripartite-type tricarboxylate transporter receptor subunit TctC